MEKYRYEKGEYHIEIEAPREHADKFIKKYYPDFKIVEN